MCINDIVYGAAENRYGNCVGLLFTHTRQIPVTESRTICRQRADRVLFLGVYVFVY